MKRTAAYVAALALFLLPVRSRCPSAEQYAELLREEKSALPLSSYDALIKDVADSTGMDWHLIAAVIYHESRFHNDASSRKGAVGLMQILSSRYSRDYLQDPANNLAVGSRYLSKLQEMYRDNAANPTEALKFALAAYNLGESKVWRLIGEAREAGEDSSRWNTVAGRLPKGHHTVSYVEKVLDTYAEYCSRY